jgi:hypothetical protein
VTETGDQHAVKLNSMPWEREQMLGAQGLCILLKLRYLLRISELVFHAVVVKHSCVIFYKRMTYCLNQRYEKPVPCHKKFGRFYKSYCRKDIIRSKLVGHSCVMFDIVIHDNT